MLEDKVTMKGELSIVREVCGVVCVHTHGMSVMLLLCVENWDMQPQVHEIIFQLTISYTYILLLH